MVAASASAEKNVLKTFFDGNGGAFGGWGGTFEQVEEDGKPCLKFSSAEAKQSWESQMAIDYEYKVGETYYISMDVKGTGTAEITSGFQFAGPNAAGETKYISCGDMTNFKATSEWKNVVISGTAKAADLDGEEKAPGRWVGNLGEYVGDLFITNVTLYTESEGGDTPEEPTSDWVSIITNGNANNGPSDNILARIGGKDDPAAVVANPSGEGKVFEAPIIAKTEGVNDWDSQMFIKFDQPVEEGAKIKVSFDYYCTNQRTVQTQAHGEPGNYQHWDMIGDLNAKPEWQKASKELTVSAAQAKGDDGKGSGKGLIAIAMNLSTAAEAGTFYINNVVVEIEKGAGVEAVAVPVQVNTGVYNLQGVKVANSLEEITVPGLYITNGKKVIKK